MQRRERIIGDLRPCAGDRGQERRLAGIGQADETGIGDQLQAQPDGLFLALETRIGPIGRLVRRGLEMRVAEAAIAALGNAEALALGRQVDDQGLVVFFEDLGADRNLQRHVFAIGAGPVAAHAVRAGLCLEVLLEAEVDERVQAVDGLDPHVTAAAAVAAVGSAELDELFAPKRDSTGAAVARANVYLSLIEKFHLAAVNSSVRFCAEIAAIDIAAWRGGQRVS
jgi:hypothetical protein